MTFVSTLRENVPVSIDLAMFQYHSDSPIYTLAIYTVYCYFKVGIQLYWWQFHTCRFQMQYGVRAQTALPYAMNSEFSRVMATQMVCSFFYVWSVLITSYKQRLQGVNKLVVGWLVCVKKFEGQTISTLWQIAVKLGMHNEHQV